VGGKGREGCWCFPGLGRRRRKGGVEFLRVMEIWDREKYDMA